jgi:hypothetical protein
LNNSANDPSGAGNSTKVPTPPGTNAAGTANSTGSASSGQGGVSGAAGSGSANPGSTTGVSTNRAGTPGDRIDGETNPLPRAPSDATIKAQESKVDAKIKSICKGC